MTFVFHNIMSFALAGGLVYLVARTARRDKVPLSGLAAAVGGGAAMLIGFGLVSAILYRSDNFGRIQVLAWSVFLHVPVFLVASGFALWHLSRVLAFGVLGTAMVLGLVALDAFLIEPQWLQVSTVTLRSTKLAESLRVVVLADIQTDAPGPYEARVLKQAMAQEPDLFLFAGDYIQLGRRSRDYETELAALRTLLQEAGMSAPLGAYAVAGNVDRPGAWMQLFEGLPVSVMDATTQQDLGSIILTGLSMSDAFRVDLSLPQQSKFHIVLGHSPNFSLSSLDADLLIAGHTHGGQVRLPFIGPLLTLTAAPRSWASGVTEINPGQTLVVSRGIGMERANAPRLRFLCRPELVVLDLLPE